MLTPGGNDSRTQYVVMKQLTGVYVSIGIAVATFSDKVTADGNTAHSKKPSFQTSFQAHFDYIPRGCASAFLRSVIYKN